MSTTTCPVFHPIDAEFSDFKSYIRKIKDDCRNIGICKIIPPHGWFHRTYNLSDLDEEINVDTPLKQILSGRAGVYDASLLETKSMSVTDIYNYDSKNSVANNEDIDNDYEGRERKFWRSLGNTSDWDHPIYGADVPGSLFGSSTSSWNVNTLEDSVLSLLDQRLPGVNTSYLYIGTWRSFFAIHTEDFDLYSINYVHTGGCKSWYAVPVSDRQRFENMAQGYFPEDHQQCKEFLRHKTKLFSPIKLKQHGIAFTTVLQHAGEFVVTFPGSYHCGYNHGFNIAESTNFATPDWFEIGRKAHCCVCRPGSVRIDVPYLETLYLRHCREMIQKSKHQLIHKKHQQQQLQQLKSIQSNIYQCNDDSESNDNNSIHGMSERRLRCKCGKDQPLVIVDHACLYSCHRCGLFSHYQCMPQYYMPVNKKVGKKLTMLCYICETIDNVEYDDYGDVEVTTTLLHNTNSTPPLSSSSLLLSSSTSTSNFMNRKRRSRANQGTRLLNQHVVSEDGTVVGVVTNVEDDMCRVHKKGTRREEDVWIEAYALVIDINNASVVTTTVSAPLENKQTRKKRGTMSDNKNNNNNNNNTNTNIDWNTCSFSTTTPMVQLSVQAIMEKNLLAIGGEATIASSTLVFQRMMSSPSESSYWFDNNRK